ncbi:MAG: SGNH/GDSL hydrolase family protein, partial [Bacteroidales bacterium]|nr:SGNH/GDSL hydrolase family protein [Bacteroidales bacterium]
MLLRKYLLAVILSVLFSTLFAQTAIPPFKKGERVLFVGNSITHGGHYHSFIWLYYITRFPGTAVTIMNGGIGGDSAWDIEKRMDEDILSKQPTYVTLTFGMNDVGYFEFLWDDAEEHARQKIERSYNCYKNIERKLLDDKRMTKVLIGGSPYDETSKIENQVFPKKNDAILKIVDFQEEAAQKNGWGFVDFNRPMLEINRREQQKDPLFALCGGDRIHPDNDGHMVMAYLFLTAQGLAGKKVAEVDIDASKSKVNISENCTVSKIKKTTSGIEFIYLAKALPYPIDSIARGWGSKRSQADALTLVPFTEMFNQEILRVKYLPGGMYELRIDDQSIVMVSSGELSEGINLADMERTPQYQQASVIMHLNEERFDIEKRFRDYAWMEFSFLQGKGMLFANNMAAVDTIRSNWDNGFVRGNFGIYSKAQYPEIRKMWQGQMDEIV